MGLLDHLWDDTVAGPPPETGLGKLCKLRSLGSGSTSTNESNSGNANDPSGEPVRITRSITIVKPPGYQPSSSLSPSSPADSTPPLSPLLSGSGSLTRFRRRSTSDAYEKTREFIPRSPFDI